MLKRVLALAALAFAVVAAPAQAIVIGEFRPRGPVRARTLAWWLHRWIPEAKDQPVREYLVVSFMTRVGEESDPFAERVTLRRDDDGTFRVAAVWTPRP